MKRKIISFISALSAAVVLLTGCGAEPVPYERKSQPTAVYSDPADVTVSYEQSTSSETPDTSSEPETPAIPPITPTPLPIYSSTIFETTPDPTAVVTENGLTAAPAQSTFREPFLDTTSEEFVEYTTGNAELNSGANKPYLFNFKTRMAVGYSLNDTKNQLPVEADYGIRGEFKGSAIRLGVYNNTDTSITLKEAYLEALEASINQKEKLPSVMGQTAINSDLNNDKNGLYRVSATFSNDTTAHLYFIINGDEFMFCQMIMASTFNTDKHHNINTIRRRRADIHRLLDEWNVTPENSLDVSVIKYPTKEKYRDGKLVWRCDTNRWAAISDEICDPSWSDERKAYVICDWMSQNLAYSRYVSRVIHTDVAFYHDDYTGKYSVYDLRAGVCRDFGQILTIMLRQQGIPAEVMANDEHLWNIAYLNGTWIEIDICCSVSKVVEGADATIRTPKTGADYLGLLSMSGQMNHLTEYATSLHRFLYVGQSVF